MFLRVLVARYRVIGPTISCSLAFRFGRVVRCQSSCSPRRLAPSSDNCLGLLFGRRDSSPTLCSPSHQALSPLIAGSCRDPILPAQHSKVPTPRRPQSKLDSLLHRFTFFPWHSEVLTSSHH